MNNKTIKKATKSNRRRGPETREKVRSEDLT
jgi:hypothetical protein